LLEKGGRSGGRPAKRRVGGAGHVAQARAEYPRSTRPRAHPTRQHSERKALLLQSRRTSDVYCRAKKCVVPATNAIEFMFAACVAGVRVYSARRGEISNARHRNEAAKENLVPAP